MVSGEPAFAPPTSSSVVPCPSAARPTFIAIVEGASRPSAEPFVPPGDAGGPTFSPAEWPRVLSPDASPGSATSPLTSSGPIPATSSSPCDVLNPAERPREASVAEVAFRPPNRSFRRGMPAGRRHPDRRVRGRSPNAQSPTGFATSPSYRRDPLPRCRRPPARCSRAVFVRVGVGWGRRRENGYRDKIPGAPIDAGDAAQPSGRWPCRLTTKAAAVSAVLGTRRGGGGPGARRATSPVVPPPARY